jgi:hypothetical protein
LVEGEPDLLRGHADVVPAKGSAYPVTRGEEALWNQRGCREKRSLFPPPGCGVGSHRTLKTGYMFTTPPAPSKWSECS